jgi:hypothetical protein
MGQQIVIGSDEHNTDHTANQEKQMAWTGEAEVGNGDKQDNIQSTKRQSKIEMEGHPHPLSESQEGTPRRGKRRLPH